MDESPGPAIRSASAADSVAIADLFLAARQHSMPYLPPLHTAAETLEWVEGVVLVECDVHLLLDARGGALLGFAARRGSGLEHLYVAPGEQGKGYGALLLQHVIDQRADEVLLRVFQSNGRARRFYERHGFAPIATSEDGNEERLPDVTYRRAGSTASPELGG